MASSIGEPAAERRPSDLASPFPRRFYQAVSTERTEGGFELRLDRRSARTPGRNPLVLPSRAMAEAVAAEWAGVAGTIDPRLMPLTRLANTVIDGVARMQDEVLAEIVRFAGSDLLAYRAAEPDDLVLAQRAAWDPVVDWMRDNYGAHLVLTERIVHVTQPPETMHRIAAVVREMAGRDAAAPFRVAALHVMTTLTGSALLAIAAAAKKLGPQAAWAAAHVDENYQIDKWGQDDEAASRRDIRWADMSAAITMFDLADRSDLPSDIHRGA